VQSPLKRADSMWSHLQVAWPYVARDFSRRARLDLMNLTPLEVMRKVDEWQKRARQGGERP